MKISFENQLNNIINQHIKLSGVKKKELFAIQEKVAQLDVSYTSIMSKIGDCFSIVNAADYGTEMYTMIEEIQGLSKAISPLLSQLIADLEDYASLYEGRKRSFYQASEAFYVLNKDFNLNFTATCEDAAQLKLSFNPLVHPLKSKELIAKSYYLVVQRYAKVCNLESAERAFVQGNNNVIKLKLKPEDFSKPAKLNLKVAQLKTIDGNALKRMYNYQAYLFAELKDAYKKEIGNYNNYLSFPSFPFGISKELNAYTPLKCLHQFDAYVFQLNYLNSKALKFDQFLNKKKALNPLISSDLLDAMTGLLTQLQNQQKQNAACLKLLVKIVKA